MKTLKGHQNKIFALQAVGNKIVTGSQDRTVKLWDVDAGRCLNTLSGHKDGVRCVQFDDDKIISGSDDGTCIVWAVEGEHTINAHPEHKVLCLHFDQNKMVTGSSDGNMNVWSAEEGEKMYSLKAQGGWVRSLQFAPDFLVSGHGDNIVRLWDFHNLSWKDADTTD